MTTVFLSGSRTLGRINDIIRNRIDNIIEKEMKIIIGDANGADKSMQGYLAEQAYRNVTVYFVGEHFRNNVGQWDTVKVPTDPGLTGRDFYAQKDREMARIAEFGLVLWDGESAGSVHNIFELLKYGKKVAVYYSPEKKFYNIDTTDSIKTLLKKCDLKTFDTIVKKHNIARSLQELEESKQGCFSLI